MKKLFFSFLLFLSVFSLSQQFGGNPPSLKWKQINTDTARIIFPETMDSAAERVASIVHFLAQKNVSLGNKLWKINIVLQNQTTIANGYVGLGPYRSEFFLTPSLNNFDIGSISWPEMLAVHEYRHVQQYSNFNTGLSRVMYYLSGEEGLALAINASVPDWFYEGDAVYNETVHTQQGRGRIPFFTNQYKSLWLADKKYSWMKLRNGSLKDYVPNHYPLGYLLVNYGYEKYGADFWKKVTKDAASYKGLFYPFQKAIKTHAGVDYKTFRKEAFDNYRQHSDMQYKSATQQAPGQGAIAGNTLRQAQGDNITTINKSYVTDYLFPYQIGDDSLLYLENDYRHRYAFFIKDKNGSRRLRGKDISLDEHFGYRNGKIVYAAYKPDARWGWRDYSVIRLLDINTKQEKTLTYKTKYFTPDISEDGMKVVAVNIDPSGKSELHVLDANNGEVLQRIKSSEIGVFTDPKFIDNNSLVTAVRLNDGRMALAHVDISTGGIERLTPPSYNIVGSPNVDNGIVYFTASYFGNDDLFALDIKSKKVYQVTQTSLGNYYANAANNKIVYSTFTADGYQLREMPLPDFKTGEVNVLSLQETVQPFAVAKSESYNDLRLNNIANRNFPASKYKKGTKLFNFHSWRPYYEDPEFTYSLYGENVLNTFQTELYYLYNQDEKTNAVGFNADYGALFPVISGGTEFTFSRTDTLNNLTRQWNQLDTRIGLSIPLDFSGGQFFRFLNFGSSYVLRNEFNTGPNKNVFAENNFSYLSHFISFSQQLQRARQHIYPRFGYGLSLQHRHAITTYEGYQFIGSGTLFLPGLVSTHSLVLAGSFQQRDTLRLLFGNRFAGSRGYNDYYLSRMWRMSANYHFPVWIPDWGFGNILYIQRIRANAFYDFTKVYSRDKTVTRNLRSAGGEIYFDTNWWNQYPLTFGIRFSHLLDNELAGPTLVNRWEIILPVSIFPK